jgi:hypothetical protein
MTVNLLAAEEVTGWAKSIADLGGWTACILLVLFAALALHRGWIRLGREFDKLLADYAKMEADRDRWLNTAYQGAELVQKQGNTMKQVVEIAAKGQNQ